MMPIGLCMSDMQSGCLGRACVTPERGAAGGSPGGRLGRAGAVLQAGVPVHPDEDKGKELDDLDVEARNLGHQGAPPQVMHCSQRAHPRSTTAAHIWRHLEVFRPLEACLSNPSGAYFVTRCLGPC